MSTKLRSKGVSIDTLDSISTKGDKVPSTVSNDDTLGLGTEEHYRTLQHGRQVAWAGVVGAFEARQTFHNAYHYLNNHPIFHRFERVSAGTKREHEGNLLHSSGMDMVEVMVVRVNPKTNEIDDDPTLNTRTQVWLETGANLWKRDILARDRKIYGMNSMRNHDIDLDCGAATFERAVVKLARKVHDKYGNDRSMVSY